MAARLINVSIAMDSEVEYFSVHSKALIDRRQQHVFAAAEIVNRYAQQSVIASRVTCDNGGVAVSTCLIGTYNLSLQ